MRADGHVQCRVKCLQVIRLTGVESELHDLLTCDQSTVTDRLLDQSINLCVA